MTKYYDEPPAPPLRVEAGRNIVDKTNRILIQGTRVTEDYSPAQGTLKRSACPADTDTFVRDLVVKYNQHGYLVDVLRTLRRELSPHNRVAFDAARDIPRIYEHVSGHLDDITDIDTAPVGDPAIMEIPPMPVELPEEFEDAWQKAWVAGFSAAWKKPNQ